MPFYATEDLTCFVFAAITEYNEALDKDERRDDKKAIESIVYNNSRAQLKILCEEFLGLSSQMDTSLPIFAAMLNSINLDNLNEYLRDWLADCDVDEKAEDEDESESETAEDEDEDESETESVPAPVPGKTEKQIRSEMEEGYAMLRQIADELNALSRC